MRRPCLTCSKLSDGSYCAEHDPNRYRKRTTPGRTTRAQTTFRRAVLAASGYRCQYVEHGIRCQVTGAQNLTAHHLKRLRDVLSYDPADGVALCLPHHREAERRLSAANCARVHNLGSSDDRAA